MPPRSHYTVVPKIIIRRRHLPPWVWLVAILLLCLVVPVMTFFAAQVLLCQAQYPGRDALACVRH